MGEDLVILVIIHAYTGVTMQIQGGIFIIK